MSNILKSIYDQYVRIFAVLFISAALFVSSYASPTFSGFEDTGTLSGKLKSADMKVLYEGQDSNWASLGKNGPKLEGVITEEFETIIRKMTVKNTSSVDFIYSLDSSIYSIQSGGELLGILEAKAYINDKLEYEGPLSGIKTSKYRLNMQESHRITLELTIPAFTDASQYTRYSNAWGNQIVSFKTEFLNGNPGFAFKGKDILTSMRLPMWIEELGTSAVYSTSAELSVKTFEGRGATMQIADNPDFVNAKSIYNPPTAVNIKYVRLADLTPNTTYYARSIVDDPVVEGAWSKTLSFTTQP